MCSPCTGKEAQVVRAQLDPPRGRASNPASRPALLSLVTSVSGAESLFSRAIKKTPWNSGGDWKTFIKLFMSTRESCLVAAASPFASVIFGSALGLCSSLAQKCIYKLERSTAWRALLVWEAASLGKTIFQYNKLLDYICREFGTLYTLTVHCKTVSELTDLQPNKHTRCLRVDRNKTPLWWLKAWRLFSISKLSQEEKSKPVCTHPWHKKCSLLALCLVG